MQVLSEDGLVEGQRFFDNLRDAIDQALYLSRCTVSAEGRFKSRAFFVQHVPHHKQFCICTALVPGLESLGIACFDEYVAWN
jgi:hypothetical protein